MTLPYLLRLFCLLTIAAGLVDAAAQAILFCAARPILRRLHAAAPRRQERLLYLVQIAPALLAILVAGALCLPEYLIHEPARAAEPVGSVTLLLAASLCAWFGASFLRGLRTVIRTIRFARTCRKTGRIVHHVRGTPLLAHPDPIPPLCLVGFFRPFIVISRKLLEPGTLNPGALNAALEHERAHIHQFDNWKMLFLCFLPTLPRDPWRAPWQLAADWAADDDAACGDPVRSLLLADALVRTARLVTSSRSEVICAALTRAESSLAMRVDRLIHPRSASRANATPLLYGLTSVVLLAVSAAVAVSPWIYSASEHILHLGGF